MINKVIDEINSLDNDYVLKASPTELEKYFVNKVLIAPLVLRVGERYIKNQAVTEIDVSRDFMGLLSRRKSGSDRNTNRDRDSF